MVRRIGLLSLMLLVGCSTLKSNRNIVDELSREDTKIKELNIVSKEDIENAAKTPSKYKFKEESLDGEYETLEQIPVEVNVAVEKWIDYFTGRGKKHMEVYLSRSTRYLPIMKNILKQQGVPEDLVYMALIESGFNSSAYSSASAVGYWQFIRGTAQRYGLRMDPYVDERRDFVRSTQAAGQYLKALYNLFGEWYLAIAAYNVGENRIKRMVMRYYTRDFWELARRKKLPRETINYVPKYIAAKLIAKNPKKYGFHNVDYQEPLSFDEIQVNKAVNLETFAKEMGLSYKEMKKLNPMYRDKLAMPEKGKNAIVKVPPGKLSLAKASIEKHFVTDPHEIAQMKRPDYIRYRVRRGDTLGRIARRYGTRISTLRRVNNIRGSLIHVGKRILVPANSASARSVSSYPTNGTHRVRRGENLSLIATRYNTNVQTLKAANNLRSSRIYPGKRLRIPGHSTSSSSPEYHRVKRGENLSLIATKYGLSIQTIKSLNNMRSTQIYPGQKLKLRGGNSAKSSTFHVVSQGENLSYIAKKYDVSVQKLKEYNGLRSSVIYPGKKLRVSGQIARNSNMHTVRPGDTLIDIARHYNTSVRNITTANGLNNKSYIQVGKKLVIPD